MARQAGGVEVQPHPLPLKDLTLPYMSNILQLVSANDKFN